MCSVGCLKSKVGISNRKHGDIICSGRTSAARWPLLQLLLGDDVLRVTACTRASTNGSARLNAVTHHGGRSIVMDQERHDHNIQCRTCYPWSIGESRGVDFGVISMIEN